MNEYVTYDAIRKRLILPIERRFAVVPPRLLTTNTNDNTVFLEQLKGWRIRFSRRYESFRHIITKYIVIARSMILK